MNYSCNYQPETIPTLDKIYTYKEANNYKTKLYHSVKDINSGYIKYFPKQRQIEDVFSSPNFVNNCKIDASLYMNPMGSTMPAYNRTLTKNNLQKPNQLTWIQDSSEQREEIMSLQMRKMNRSMFENKW
jgi:hypothetical protein